MNHTGSDTHEFVEIFGEASTDYSHLTIVEIEGEGSGAGLIDDGVFTVGATDSSGIWVTPFQSIIENGTLSLLLVEGFFGTTGDDIDLNNDGVIDVTPWTSIVDSIGVHDGGASDFSYAETTLVSGFDGGSFTVGGASRIPNGLDTPSASDWRRNDFSGEGLPGFGTGTTFWPEAYNTPGAPNSAPVPEPGTVAILGLGLGFLCRKRRKTVN